MQWSNVFSVLGTYTGTVTLNGGVLTQALNATNARLNLQCYANDNTNYVNWKMFKSRGATVGTLATNVSGDVLAQWAWQGDRKSVV